MDQHGKKRIRIFHPSYYQHEINKLQDGERITIEIHNKRTRRSVAQNAYYWGVYLPIIAKETGESNIDRLHELFKGMFLTTEVAEVLGHKVRIKKSTTDLSIGEFSDYITKIEAETGVECPPTENYGLEKITKSIEENDTVS